MSPNRPSAPSRTTWPERLGGLAVHGFTASGAVFGFLALLAAVDGTYPAMFGWLGGALVIDAVDGTLARWTDITRTAPEFSGDILDLVVDYLTYVLVPAIALYRAGFVPDLFALPAVALILVSSAFYFADLRMKTTDLYFRGFPAVWNLYAFLVFVWRPDDWIVLLSILVFSALTFVPIAFVHPIRVRRFRRLNLVVLILTAGLCAAALGWDLDPPDAIKIALGFAAAYFLAIGLFRPSPAAA